MAPSKSASRSKKSSRDSVSSDSSFSSASSEDAVRLPRGRSKKSSYVDEEKSIGRGRQGASRSAKRRSGAGAAYDLGSAPKAAAPKVNYAAVAGSDSEASSDQAAPPPKKTKSPSTTAPTPIASPAAVAQPTKKSNKCLWIILGILLCVAIIVAVLIALVSSAINVATWLIRQCTVAIWYPTISFGSSPASSSNDTSGIGRSSSESASGLSDSYASSGGLPFGSSATASPLVITAETRLGSVTGMYGNQSTGASYGNSGMNTMSFPAFGSATGALATGASATSLPLGVTMQSGLSMGGGIAYTGGSMTSSVVGSVTQSGNTALVTGASGPMTGTVTKATKTTESLTGSGQTQSTASPSKTGTASGTILSGTAVAQATYFQATNKVTVCGTNANDGQYVVHLSPEIYGDVNTHSKYWGTWISMWNPATNWTTHGTVQGVCKNCQMYNIDVSRAVFASLGDIKSGTLSNIQWWDMPPDKDGKYPSDGLQTESATQAATQTARRMA